jgi:hypothetical protein
MVPVMTQTDQVHIDITISFKINLNNSLLKNLIVANPVNKFDAFYGTRMFITVFTTARQWSLFWAKWSINVDLKRTKCTGVIRKKRKTKIKILFKRNLRTASLDIRVSLSLSSFYPWEPPLFSRPRPALSPPRKALIRRPEPHVISKSEFQPSS